MSYHWLILGLTFGCRATSASSCDSSVGPEGMVIRSFGELDLAATDVSYVDLGFDVTTDHGDRFVHAIELVGVGQGRFDLADVERWRLAAYCDDFDAATTVTLLGDDGPIAGFEPIQVTWSTATPMSVDAWTGWELELAAMHWQAL